MIGAWHIEPVPEPQPGVILLMVESGEAWAYVMGTDGAGRPDWVLADGDPLGYSSLGAAPCGDMGPWMLVIDPDRCPKCGEEPQRCACAGDSP